MKPTRHIIADLETMDTLPSAVILTAGLIAVEITDTGLTVLSRWYRRLQWDTGHRQPGRTVSQDTVDWWLNQSDEAFIQAFEDDGHRLPIWLAMQSLSAWLKLHPYPIRGNGSDFDNAILQHAFQQHGLRWPYWQNRCLRSLKGDVTQLNPDLKLPEWPEHLTKHVAIDDAEYEAHVLAVLLREMERPGAERRARVTAAVKGMEIGMAAMLSAVHQMFRSRPAAPPWLSHQLNAIREAKNRSDALRLATLGRENNPSPLNL
ncbi:putative exonuclease, phage related [Pseudogulbenkiania sp. NH8B]|uniref:3'-5' exonuclease n=1 Tax=Pseudogulbenkiania sp. (strain NH8B) TaxID=748280 RepID=UPI000227958A|nr:3'-5' exonuclease [Pseudogulbenkiania sp. NH8B]BAK75421.1 putative exonuclease, phage related [Pseudogulbenkiania sp. NH8B]